MNKLLFLLCFISCSVFGQKVKKFTVLDLPNAKLSRHIQHKDTVYVLSGKDFRDPSLKTTFTVYKANHDKMKNYLTKCVGAFDTQAAVAGNVQAVEGSFVTLIKKENVTSMYLHADGADKGAYTNLTKEDLINFLSKL